MPVGVDGGGGVSIGGRGRSKRLLTPLRLQGFCARNGVCKQNRKTKANDGHARDGRSLQRIPSSIAGQWNSFLSQHLRGAFNFKRIVRRLQEKEDKS